MALYKSNVTGGGKADIKYLYGDGANNIDLTCYNRHTSYAKGTPFTLSTDSIHCENILSNWRASDFSLNEAVDLSLYKEIIVTMNFNGSEQVSGSLDLSEITESGYFILEIVQPTDLTWRCAFGFFTSKQNYLQSSSTIITRTSAIWESSSSPTVDVHSIILVKN